MCHNAWSERFNYLCIDMGKNKNEIKYRIFNESKKLILNVFAKMKLFKSFKCFFQVKTEDLEKLEELVSLQNQVKAVRLQDKLDKQNFHEDVKKIFEPVTKSLENTSKNITKCIMESSINNNQAIENLNEKVLELMNDKGMIAPYLAPSLANLFKPENKSQLRFKKRP